MKPLDSLITGQRHLHTSRCSIQPTFQALRCAHTILLILERQGEPAAFRYLEGVRRGRQPWRDDTEALLVARHLSATVQRFLRLRSPGVLCLARALAVGAALRSAGIPVQVVIGRRLVRGGRLLVANTVQGYDFHAWAELDGRVLTDAPINKLGHLEMVRVPVQAKGSAVHAGA